MGARITGIALLLLLVPAAAEEPGERDFVKDLHKAQKYVRDGRWKLALKTYDKLLEEHAERDYVRLRRTDIVADYGRCLFRTQNPEPDLSEIVSGRVVSFDRRSGKIKIVYRPGALGDFKKVGKARVHPMVFAGPHSIELRGSSYPVGGIRLLVGLGTGSAYSVAFGFAARQGPSIHVLVRDKWHRQASKAQSPLKVREPFTVKVSVGKTAIQARYKGRLLVQCAKRPAYGPFGIYEDKFATLTVAGKINPGWMLGRIESYFAARRKKFEARFEPRKILPAWLFREVTAPAPEASAPEDEWPDEIEADHLIAVSKVALLVAQDKYREALDYIQGRPEDALPPLTRGYLLAQCHFELDDLEQALAACEPVCDRNARFVHARLLRARLYLRLRRRQEAVDEYLRIVEEFSSITAQIEAAVQLLRAGRQEDALRIVRAARAKVGVSKELDALERMLTMAQLGPQWSRVFEYRTKNYMVRSDIDKAICIEAAKTLEQAYTAYQAQLGRVKGLARGKRFRVYVFSAEPGYQRYCGRIVGRAVMHSAGLYSPNLKQLLIWNLPDRTQMFRTIRHEGFHQYLDSVVPEDPPVWLNEGLAEYYETAKRTSRGTRGGQRRPDHLMLLQKPLPLAEFLYIKPPQFYANARLHYAQAWAVVHFLQHADRKTKRLFDRLIDELQKGRGADNAVRAVFPKDELPALEKQFRRYVWSLRHAGLAKGRR
ncbi:MAG: hypothetical protein O7C98_16440 [Planctomycetota bacterium]|nr:hypothetical protein [Planctomycetota bacterium]